MHAYTYSKLRSVKFPKYRRRHCVLECTQTQATRQWTETSALQYSILNESESETEPERRKLCTLGLRHKPRSSALSRALDRRCPPVPPGRRGAVAREGAVQLLLPQLLPPHVITSGRSFVNSLDGSDVSVPRCCAVCYASSSLV